MADIEFVVRLDQETLQDLYDSRYVSPHIKEVFRSATPLPKGHGRLGDLDAICKDVIESLGIKNETFLLEAEKAVYKRIKNASTIIEADTQNKEKENKVKEDIMPYITGATLLSVEEARQLDKETRRASGGW